MPMLLGSFFVSYLAFFVFVVVVFWGAAKEDLGIPLIFTLAILCAYQFLSDWHPFTFLAMNWLSVLLFGLAYICIGIVWVVFKWTLLCKRKLAKDIEYSRSRPSFEFVPPSPSRHKEKIVSWLAYWPFSMLIYACFDALREFFSMIYTKISGSLQKISNRIYKDYVQS